MPYDAKLQILSPARDLSVAKAAIQAGADAVYIGAPRFGAREAAGNSLDDIAALVRYAHPFGVKVLVTLNTLLNEDEIPEALAIAQALYNAHINALIVQDLRFADILFHELPELRLHASTQCDNRTPEQVAHLRDLGFKRVVLARELSLDEIRAIHRAVPDIELEAFVHGALCVSYSGRCYMSEVLLGRSANRGCCAQMCRMRYDLLDADGNEIIDDNGQPIHQRYLLSLQDLDRSAYLAELIDAGVTTFKIEGRLKDAAYVTNITAYYRQKLDSLTAQRSNIVMVQQHSGLTTKWSFSPDPAKTFHRGATDYFLHGRTRPMANWQTPKSTGEHIGELLEAHGRTVRVRLLPGIVLHNGDGLTVGDEGFAVNGVTPQPDGTVLIKTSSPVTPNSSPLTRNLDVDFLASLHAERRVPVTIIFAETENGFRLTIGEHSREFAYPKETARNEQKAMDTIRTQLSRLGDTIFTAADVQIESKPYFIPISTLNEWRRLTLIP